MTLAELLPTARQLSAIEKLKLIQILAEDLDIAEEIAPLDPLKTYDLPTSYDCWGKVRQTNFFLEFEVCFYRAKLEFEVKPKLP
jgi:hypothetical protein